MTKLCPTTLLQCMMFCLIMCANFAMSDADDKKGEVWKTLRDAYSAAASDIDKRDVIFAAIDESIIRPGITLADLRRFFGNELLVKRPTDVGRKEAYVKCLRFKNAGTTTRRDSAEVTGIQPPDVGWGIKFVVSPDDKLESYYLSDSTGKGGGRTEDNQIADREYERFLESLQRATKEKDKRGVVLRGIDEKLISPGMMLTDLKKLFGKSLRLEKVVADGHITGYVPLGDAEPSQRRSTTTSFFPPGRGWYIYFEFMPGSEQVGAYWLSNIHD